jgi:hypothetical protein
MVGPGFEDRGIARLPLKVALSWAGPSSPPVYGHVSYGAIRELGPSAGKVCFRVGLLAPFSGIYDCRRQLAGSQLK